jgi:drug/metabolite transporter (DMT)-like permease
MSVIWGLPYLLIRIAVRDFQPATLVFARTAPAALLLIPIAIKRDAIRPLLGRWKIVVAYTIIEVAVPWFLLSRAEQRLSSSVSGLLVATVPLIGAGIAGITGSEHRLDRRQLVGVLVGLGGVATLVGVNVRGSSLIGVGEILLTAIGYATGPVIISRRFSDIPSIGPVAVSFLLTAAVYAPYALTHLPKHISGEELSSVILLTLICTSLAFIVFFALIAEIGPVRATVITYINPAVAVVLGVSLLHEPLTLGIVFGFVLILFGSFLSTRHGQPREPRHPGLRVRATATGSLGEQQVGDRLR